MVPTEHREKILDMNERPLVSIVSPCFNHEKFLRDFFNSIFEQDYGNIQVLICDDCSTDQSWAVLKEIEKEAGAHERIEIKIIRNERNLGVTKTVNKLISMSEGKFIKSLASDDMLASKKSISTMVNFFENNKEADVVVCNGSVIEEEEHYPVLCAEKKIYRDTPDFQMENLFEKLYYENFISASGAMVRRSIYDEFGLYDEDLLTEDWEFWLRITKSGKTKIVYLEDQLVYYRRSSNSMTSLSENRGLEERRLRLHTTEMKIIEKYKEYVPKRMYAVKKMRLILGEQNLARKQKFVQLYQVTENEYNSFGEWKDLNIRDKMYFLAIKRKDKFLG